MKSAVFTLVAGCLLAAAAPSAQTQPADGRTQSIYVGVVDGKGNAVTGLTAKDFVVREDGVAREVLRVEPSSEQLDIVLLVDDSQAATAMIPHMRDALTRFVARMQGKAKIGIVTVGERPTSVVERTSDPEALKKGIGRIFARGGSGAYLLEGINEVLRGFRGRELMRPTIVALTAEGVEYSNLQHERINRDLVASGAALHVLAIGTPAPTDTDEMRNRNLVLAEGSEFTGGRREQLLSAMALEDRLEQLSAELVNQYVVTYGRPETLIPPEKVQVTVNTAGLTARTRTRLPKKK
ncbi:MAG: VWA domain-containing protein [Acidobacteria bacterium]|nr:VWA domain-containing protein [Acidobacteriota bacterium]